MTGHDIENPLTFALRDRTITLSNRLGPDRRATTLDIRPAVGQIEVGWKKVGGGPVNGARELEPPTGDAPETCQIPGCDTPVENFDEAFPVPAEIDHRGDGRAVMCDHHHVAARLLSYTRPEPPYVDVGLYKEVAYYARALAAETFEVPAEDKVTPPQHHDEDAE